ncbi:MAG TPA: hypothetical protein VGG99_00330 [Acetobacteraceae bacterium]|jgi:hypothetical protein
MTRPSDPSAARSPEMENYLAYRRLLYRGYVLYARVTALQCLLAVVSPFATPGIIRAIRRWFEHVATDVNALNRSVRSLRLRIAAERKAQSVLERTAPVMVEFRNPWV